MTENDASYKALDFTRCVVVLTDRHQRIRGYTPRHDGKVEWVKRPLADEVFSARPYPSEQERRAAIGGVSEPFQLPSAPYRLRRSAPGLTRPGQSR